MSKMSESVSAALVLFEQDARAGALALAELIRDYGYAQIRPYLLPLSGRYHDFRHRDALILLRQPDWVWRACLEASSIRIYGVESAGEFVALGYYATGDKETGIMHMLDVPGELSGMTLGAPVPDPRSESAIQAVRPEVLLRKRRYWAVLRGRVIDLVRAGCSREDIIRVGRRFYARVAGPFEERAQAKAHHLVNRG